MLKTALIVLGIIVLAVGGFILWRVWATRAGAKNVYLRLTQRIAAVEDRLTSGEDPDPADVERFARDRETRIVLHDALKHHGKWKSFVPGRGVRVVILSGAPGGRAKRRTSTGPWCRPVAVATDQILPGYSFEEALRMTSLSSTTSKRHSG